MSVPDVEFQIPSDGDAAGGRAQFDRAFCVEAALHSESRD
jgi:hypothetical protein